jgi:hypothetical protein
MGTNHCRLVMISSGRSPLLVELHGVSDRLGLTEERARFSEHLDGFGARSV